MTPNVIASIVLYGVAFLLLVVLPYSLERVSSDPF